MTQTTNTQRANRIAVAIEDGQLVAKLYRTHKHLATVRQADTLWTPHADNKNTQREEYRQFVIDHDADYGISYQPEDMRTQTNLRKASYPTDADLEEDAVAMVWSDVSDLVASNPHGLSLSNLTVDAIVPQGVTPSGRLLSDLGIEAGKYSKSGKWAWATLQMCATIEMAGHADQPIYATFEMALVSGQLKKPTSFNGQGFTKTAWAGYLTKELIAAGLVADQSAPAAETPAAETPAEEVVPKTRKTKKDTNEEALTR